MLDVQRWAEIRRMRDVERLSIREIARRTGHDRNTVRRALRREGPPSYRRGPSSSKLDPFREEILGLLRSGPRIPGKRVRELITESGYWGGKTILDDYLREVRPIVCPKRTYQRTIYRPGELLQFDLWEPSREIPVGFGQTRRGFVVTAELGYSRALAGALVFSKQAPDLLFGMGHCLRMLGALPETVVWDREGALHAGGGRASDELAAFCGQLPVGWLILEARDPESKGALERSHRFLRSSFEPARPIAGPEHFQAELDAWCCAANGRVHATLRERPSERLAKELERMRPLPVELPDTDRRFVTRVPQQPYLRLDTNDYSVDPRLAGRRVEVRASQRELIAVALDSGELAARHRRSFAKHRTFTDPAHQTALDALRGRRRRGPDVEVQLRPLERYDALIPA